MGYSDREWFPAACAGAIRAGSCSIGFRRGAAGSEHEERRTSIAVDGEQAARGSHFKGSGTLWRRCAASIGIQPMTEPLVPYKFIVHVAKAKAGLPIRGGLARAAGWAYLFKNYVLKDWVTFAEVYGQPLRVGKYGPGATEQDKETLLQSSSKYRHRCRRDRARFDAHRIHRGAADRQRRALPELLPIPRRAGQQGGARADAHHRDFRRARARARRPRCMIRCAATS